MGFIFIVAKTFFYKSFLVVSGVYGGKQRDPVSKLFVILMQPQETLKRCTAYMDKYFRRETYLTKDDPDLWIKLIRYLKELQ